MRRDEYRAIALLFLIILPIGLFLLVGPARTMFLSLEERHVAELRAVRSAGDLDTMQQLAEGGDVDAQLELARMLTTRQRPEDALAWFTAAAEQGQIGAMVTLGDWYSRGYLDAVPQNLEAAANWYRRASLRGSAYGQYRYALALLSGDGIATDEQEAVAWLTAAAAQQHRSAMVALAALYSEGRGVERNIIEAYALLAASLHLSDNDFGDGDFERQRIAELETEMTADDIVAASARAQAWLRL